MLKGLRQPWRALTCRIAIFFPVRSSFMLWADEGSGNESPKEPATGEQHAERTARPEATGRHHCGGYYGCEDRDRRNRREIEGAFGEGAFWTRWRRSSREETVTGGTVGHRQKGGGRALGIMSGVRLSTAARYLCEKAGWRLSNLSLQKLLYLAQVEYAGHNDGARLTDTVFEAWKLGPVSPDLFHKVKIFGSDPIQDVFYDALKFKDGSPRRETLDTICEQYLGATPSSLIEATHWNLGAWAKKYEPDTRNIVITDRDILEEYNNRTRHKSEWRVASHRSRASV